MVHREDQFTKGHTQNTLVADFQPSSWNGRLHPQHFKLMYGSLWVTLALVIQPKSPRDYYA